MRVPDIYDDDDDNDGIPTSVEIQYHLNADYGTFMKHMGMSKNE